MIVEKAATVEPSWNITEVLGILGIEFDIDGEPMKSFHHFAALGEATSDDLTFCSSEPEKAAVDIVRTGGGVILCKRQLKGLLQPRQGSQLVYVENPRRTFVKVVKELHKRIK